MSSKGKGQIDEKQVSKEAYKLRAMLSHCLRCYRQPKKSPSETMQRILDAVTATKADPAAAAAAATAPAAAAATAQPTPWARKLKEQNPVGPL